MGFEQVFDNITFERMDGLRGKFSPSSIVF